jgi:hypothetical protein
MKIVRVAMAVGAWLLAVGPFPVAEAGQPWSCVCRGKPKRFIASTHMCEKDLHKASGKPAARGFKLLVPACTRAQFIAWNTKACRAEGCKPPKF